MIHCKSFSVVWRNEIQATDIKALLSREIAAIRIPEYYDVDLCKEISDRLMSNQHYGRYINAPAIGRVGQAYFESQASEESKMRYDQKSVDWMREIRAGCKPFLSPMDKLRLELDEVWPPGAKLGCLGSTKMFAGLARHFVEGSEAEPHTDVLAWDAEEEPEAQNINNQIATNTYLSIPDQGGELSLWDVWPTKDEYEMLRKKGSYGLKRNLLPAPVATISPTLGEMILFHPQRVHAVEKIEAGSRVTWSSFFGHIDDESPLFIWS